MIYLVNLEKKNWAESMEAIGTDDELQKGNENSLPHLVGLKEKNIWRSGPHWTHVNLKTSKYYEEYFDIRADWLKMINIKIDTCLVGEFSEDRTRHQKVCMG